MTAEKACPPAHGLGTQGLSEWGYMSIGVTAAAPVVLAPIFLQPKAEREKPWHQRYWVKANAWIAIFGFVGNYLWTHYFYQVLGAAYTFKAHELNQVWWKGTRNGCELCVGKCWPQAVSLSRHSPGAKQLSYAALGDCYDNSNCPVPFF